MGVSPYGGVPVQNPYVIPQGATYPYPGFQPMVVNNDGSWAQASSHSSSRNKGKNKKRRNIAKRSSNSGPKGAPVEMKNSTGHRGDKAESERDSPITQMPSYLPIPASWKRIPGFQGVSLDTAKDGTVTSVRVLLHHPNGQLQRIIPNSEQFHVYLERAEKYRTLGIVRQRACKLIETFVEDEKNRESCRSALNSADNTETIESIVSQHADVDPSILHLKAEAFRDAFRNGSKPETRESTPRGPKVPESDPANSSRLDRLEGMFAVLLEKIDRFDIEKSQTSAIKVDHGHHLPWADEDCKSDSNKPELASSLPSGPSGPTSKPKGSSKSG